MQMFGGFCFFFFHVRSQLSECLVVGLVEPRLWWPLSPPVWWSSDSWRCVSRICSSSPSAVASLPGRRPPSYQWWCSWCRYCYGGNIAESPGASLRGGKDKTVVRTKWMGSFQDMFIAGDHGGLGTQHGMWARSNQVIWVTRTCTNDLWTLSDGTLWWIWPL